MKMIKSKFKLTAIFLIIMFLFCSCGTNDNVNQAKKKGDVNKSGQIVIRDILDNEIVLDKPTERIALQWGGAGGAFMTMAALDKDHFQDRIVALDTSLQETRRDMWNQFSKDVPKLKEIPTIGWLESDEFSVEKLISLNPEVFILPTGLKPNVSLALENQLKDAGIQIVYIDYHSQKLEDHIISTEIIGKLIGKEKEADELNKFYREQIEVVENKLKTINKKKPTIYFEVGMKGPKEYFTTHGKGYMFGEMIEIAGGDNISKHIKGTQVASPELVLGSNPDIIIIGGSYWPSFPDSMRLGFAYTPEQAQESLRSFTTRDGWQNLKAVKNKQVYALHIGVAREMYDFVLIQHLAKIFYPEEFKDLDPEANFREYYERFLPFKLDGTWFVQLQ
jgi:iron complex transport system substrate-binding protein